MARRFLPLLLFAIAIIVSSANILDKYVGGVALALYCLVVVLGLWGFERWLLPWLESSPERFSALLVTLLLLGLTVAMLLFYPLTNSDIPGVGSDRDEALNQATSSLLRGEYPYYQRTYLDNPITPLPGALLLAAPFVAIVGSSIWQTPLWLFIFAAVVRRWILDSRYLLLLLLSLFALAPKMDHEIVTGGDFVTNAVYVLVAFVLLIESAGRGRTLPLLLAAGFVGLALSSRLSWLPLLPLLAAAIVERSGWRNALLAGAMAMLVFAAVTLPWYVYDPAGFSPLHTANKLRGLNQVIPYAAEVTLLVAGVVSLLLAWRQRGYRAYFLNSAVVQSIPIVAGIVVPIPMLGLDFTYGSRYGASFLVFAGLAYWLWVRSRRLAPAPQP